jgi:cation:H+ antiporter
MDAFIVLVEFAVAVFIIGAAGVRLAEYGDALGEHTGLGGSWIGLMLLATVTSLPELITGVSAVVLADSPDIAVGALLGSCVFNLAILTVLDFLVGGRTLYARLSENHTLSAVFGGALLLLVTILIVARVVGVADWLSLGRVGAGTPVIFLMYVLWSRLAHQLESVSRTPASEARQRSATLRQAAGGYAISAVVVVATGVWLPFVGERMATTFHLNETFVGSLFIALVTSLPELVVTIAAVRLHAYDMAVSNLFGSNLFNLLILVPEDLLYRSGPLLAAVSPIQAISAVSGLVMTAIAGYGILNPPKRQILSRISWIGVTLAAIYLANFALLYEAGR